MTGPSTHSSAVEPCNSTLQRATERVVSLPTIERDKTDLNTEIREPSEREEYWHLCFHVLDCLPWYQKHSYHCTVPESFTSEYCGYSGHDLWQNKNAFKHFAEAVRNNKDSVYASTVSSLTSEIPALFKTCLPTLHRWNSEGWFRLFDRYRILPVSWGTGGSYAYDRADFPGGGRHLGIIFISKIDPKIEWSPKNRITTTLHELIHLGIEDTLVNRFNLSQNQKERVIDILCNFILPSGYGYWMQERGDRTIDRYLHSYLAGQSHSLAEDIANFSARETIVQQQGT